MRAKDHSNSLKFSACESILGAKLLALIMDKFTRFILSLFGSLQVIFSSSELLVKSLLMSVRSGVSLFDDGEVGAESYLALLEDGLSPFLAGGIHLGLLPPIVGTGPEVPAGWLLRCPSGMRFGFGFRLVEPLPASLRRPRLMIW